MNTYRCKHDKRYTAQRVHAGRADKVWMLFFNGSRVHIFNGGATRADVNRYVIGLLISKGRRDIVRVYENNALTATYTTLKGFERNKKGFKDANVFYGESVLVIAGGMAVIHAVLYSYITIRRT